MYLFNTSVFHFLCMALPGYFQWEDMVQRQFKNLDKIQFIYFKNANNITDKTTEVL